MNSVLLSILLLLPVLPASGRPVPRDSASGVHVVFVHGIMDSGDRFGRFEALAAERGWFGYAPSLERANGRASMTELADQLEVYIATTLPADVPYHLVGHSMGGIVLKQFLMEGRDGGRARSLTTLGSPHAGSRWAYLLPFDGCRELRPGSALLLRQAQHRFSVPALNIRSPFDLMVAYRRAYLEGAKNVRSLVPAHPLLIRTRGIFKEIARHIEETPQGLLSAGR